MDTILREAVAHGLGSLRTDRHSVPAQGRLADGLVRLACRISELRTAASPWPAGRFESDPTDRIQRQMWAGICEPNVPECFDAILEPGAVYFDVGARSGFQAVFGAHRGNALLKGRLYLPRESGKKERYGLGIAKNHKS